jgi:hypothetical protein
MPRAVRSLLSEIPASTQNPLLGLGPFHRFCDPRFRWLGFEHDFAKRLQSLARSEHLLPVYREGKIWLYATFQIWEVALLRKCTRKQLRFIRPDERFRSVLRLLLRIQDYYLPEVRTNRRTGQSRDYQGTIGIVGSFFVQTTTRPVSDFTRWRCDLIAKGRFSPRQFLEECELTPDDLREWISRFLVEARFIDPLEDWALLVSYVSYEQRQKLRFDALLAQDYYEMAELLRRFLLDCGERAWVGDYTDWNDRPTSAEDQTPTWKAKTYGRENLERPYTMLEFLTNSFTLNPKPHAIIITEGEEWQALDALFRAAGLNPDLLGIEFRHTAGEGNFTVEKWQAFVEYMHERQVLVYFVLDHEGHAAAQAEKFLQQHRLFRFPYLQKAIPAEDRIKLWNTSFEEANFTDVEIARALQTQGIQLLPRAIRAVRRASRRKGLIAALADAHDLSIKKGILALDLANLLIARRSQNPKRLLRPAEEFVRATGRLVWTNHQPATSAAKETGLKSGYLG